MISVLCYRDRIDSTTAHAFQLINNGDVHGVITAQSSLNNGRKLDISVIFAKFVF